MAENEPGPDPLGEDARLKSLDQRLAAAQQAEAHRTGVGTTGNDGGYNLGTRVLAELLGGMIGGGLIGWVLDRLFGTSPWLMLVLFFLGIGVAFRQIIRMTGKRPT